MHTIEIIFHTSMIHTQLHSIPGPVVDVVAILSYEFVFEMCHVTLQIGVQFLCTRATYPSVSFHFSEAQCKRLEPAKNNAHRLSSAQFLLRTFVFKYVTVQS